MATLIPPPSKKQKREAQKPREVDLVPADTLEEKILQLLLIHDVQGSIFEED